MHRVMEVLNGQERRRVWTEEQKLQVLAEAFGPGAIVEDVARRYDVAKSSIYRWKDELSKAHGLARVVVAPPPSPAAEPEPQPAFIEIDLGQKGSIRLPMGTPAELAAVILKGAFCQ